MNTEDDDSRFPVASIVFVLALLRRTYLDACDASSVTTAVENVHFGRILGDNEKMTAETIRKALDKIAEGNMAEDDRWELVAIVLREMCLQKGIDIDRKIE